MILRTRGEAGHEGFNFKVRQVMPGVLVSEQPREDFRDSPVWIVPEGCFMYADGKAWVENADGSVFIVPMQQRSQCADTARELHQETEPACG